MDHPHNVAFARALGPMVEKMMEDVMAVPDVMRLNATASNTIETVDGHEWTVSVGWNGFNGPATLRQAEG